MAEEWRFGGPDVVVLPPLREKERRKEVSGSISAAILHSQTAQLSSTYSRRDGGETQVHSNKSGHPLFPGRGVI